MVNKLTEQGLGWMNTFIAGKSAGNFQTTIVPPKVGQEVSQIDVSLMMRVTVNALPCQPRFYCMDGSIKGNCCNPIGVRCSGNMKETKKVQVMLKLAQMHSFRWHPSVPPKENFCHWRKKLFQRATLEDNDVEARNCWCTFSGKQIIQERTFLLNDVVYNGILPPLNRCPNFPTSIALNHQHGLNLRNLGDPLNEPLKGFLDTFSPKQSWRSHFPHLTRNFATWEGKAFAKPQVSAGCKVQSADNGAGETCPKNSAHREICPSIGRESLTFGGERG